MSDSETLKKELREAEKIDYAREMFWHEPDKQYLLMQLLQKIYNLEDEILILKSNK